MTRFTAPALAKYHGHRPVAHEEQNRLLRLCISAASDASRSARFHRQ